MTDLRSEPPASSQEAWTWRRSWTRTSKSTPEALTAGSQIRVRKVFREIGVPSRVANTRSSGPSRRAPQGGGRQAVVGGGGRGQGGGLHVLGGQPDGLDVL